MITTKNSLLNSETALGSKLKWTAVNLSHHFIYARKPAKWSDN